MQDSGSMESMITSAVFLLKKYVRTKRLQIAEALREEEEAVIEASQSLVVTLKEAQTLVEHLDSSVRSLDVSFKMIDKKIRDKLSLATVQQEMLRSRRNKDLNHQLSGSHLIPQQLQVCHSTGYQSPDLQSSSRLTPSGLVAGSAPQFRCPFCLDRCYNGKPPLLRHISDMHPDRYQDYDRIYSLTPESVFNSNEIGGSSQCHYCSFRERSKAPLLRHIQEQHADKYEFFVQIARLKGVKVPLNRAIAQPQTASIQNVPVFTAPLAIQVPAAEEPEPIENSAITPTTASNARKSLHPTPTQCNIPAVTLTPTHSNHQNSVHERTDHEYSARKRAPSPVIDQSPRLVNKIKRTRRHQAQQNKNRYMCSSCGNGFGHKSGLMLHTKFYCANMRHVADGGAPAVLIPQSNSEQRPDPRPYVPDVAPIQSGCASPAPSSSSSLELANITHKDMTAFITTVRELDVVLPESRQDDFFHLTKSPRFKQIFACGQRK